MQRGLRVRGVHSELSLERGAAAEMRWVRNWSNSCFRSAMLPRSLFFSALLVAGCSSSESSSPGVISSVDGQKPVDALTADESESLCRDLSAYYERLLTPAERQRVNCAISGAVSAIFSTTTEQARATCRAEFDKCMAKPAPVATSEGCDGFRANLGKCAGKGLTVAELEGCYEDLGQQYKLLATVDACATLEIGKGSSTPTKKSTRCAVVETKCPDLL